ncbi:putative oxidoreductase [Aspergillus oryzae 3.042]|uniref:Putative oxidoreductase n=1 Tax=Aspergillus oryzae (strain 3.042) TaxID=1160506 RepID=I8I911_ASPO3|nr:putative oxidoreductase [Aspergillus oryzae 3.042]|eukprot:EIT73616.1 putative oxidoreductase [Aspergillus oryzae 3.042]
MTSESSGVKLIFGGASFLDERNSPLDQVEDILQVVQHGGIISIDTASIYGSSEELLGKANASSCFSIDTKYPGGMCPDVSSKEAVISSAEESLRKLRTTQVDVYYLHAPDRRSPLKEVLSGIDALYKAGKFKRFGLSNFLANEVNEVIRIARENNYVLPTVYQGNYSAIARRAETELFPVIRENRLAFYAYSPIAGGFLTKTVDQIIQGKGRWDPSSALGGLYHMMYNKDSMLQGLRLWEEISKQSRIPKAELAYRWVVYHSMLNGINGDGVIVGSRNAEQLKETLAGLAKGPLLPDVVQRIEQVWEIVEGVAPLDNFNTSSAV